MDVNAERTFWAYRGSAYKSYNHPFLFIFQGDSGGPLVCYNHEDETWMLTGVVSWGEKCAYENSPGIYANVAMFSAWIAESVSENS